MNHILLFDGTWRKSKHDSNIYTLSTIFSNSDTQSVFYDPGVGTGSIFDAFIGIFGFGLDKNIMDGYKYLMKNYKVGDKVFIYGYSRGAYTARSLSGLLNDIGLTRDESNICEIFNAYRKKHSECKDEEICVLKDKLDLINVPIEMIGVFDTVGSLGIPYLDSYNKRFKFHNTTISPNTKHGYHALSLDEMAPDFPVTKWSEKANDGQVIEQVWFCGSHGDIGGGYEDDELSDYPLLWMVDKSANLGVKINDKKLVEVIARIKPIEECILHNGYWDLWYGLYGILRLGIKEYRKCTGAVGESIHQTVDMRICLSDYKPKAIGYKNLDKYKD